jgi:hypothetical protein
MEREIRKLVDAIENGVSATAIKDELLLLEGRQAELHPSTSDVYVYRARVSLCVMRPNGINGAWQALTWQFEACSTRFRSNPT